MTDEKKLEKLYNQALKHEKAGEFDQAACYYRQMLENDEADHAGAAIRLAAMGRGATPHKASPAYVATLFDQYADVFDLILVNQLQYDVPQQIRDYLEEVAPGRIFPHLLDLGCGTGLMGEALEDKAMHKTGVDLAENMIAIAHEKGDYDQLWVGDIAQYLLEAGERYWDLITATDVLPYMGEIEAFFFLVYAHLDMQGIFAFSTEVLLREQCDDVPYKVGKFQRFAHRESYIEACLLSVGFGILARYDIVVRQEQGQDVNGQLFFAMKNKEIS